MAKATFTPDTAAFIETWLNHYFPLLNQPSLSLAIIQNGRAIYQKAWGFANLEKKEPATPNHIYRVASHSKSFTAFLIAQLVDEGKLKLDEPIVTYLPWLKPNKDYATLTLRHVLSHGTGTQRDGDNSQFWDYSIPFPTTTKLKQYFLKAKPVIEPNTAFKYSNYGYSLSGFVLEAVTGQTFEQLVETRIAKPLKLKYTGGNNPSPKHKTCMGYSSIIDGQRYPLNPILSAEGMANVTGVHSTPAELATVFDSFLLSTKHISRATQKEIMRPVWPTADETEQWYCLGLTKITRNGKHYYGHAGGYPGFITRTMAAPDLGLTISIGMSSLNADTMPICHTLFDIIRFFQTERGTKNPLTRFESMFYYLWGTSYVLAGNKKLHIAYPMAPNPITAATLLEPKSKDTFINKAPDGYYSYNEPVSFTFKNGKPETMTYSSAVHTTNKAAYLSHLKTLKV